MAAMTIENINSITQKIKDLLLPELHGIKTDLRIIQSRLDSVDTRINSLDREVANIRDDIKSLRAEFLRAIDVRERLAAVEAKLSH